MGGSKAIKNYNRDLSKGTKQTYMGGGKSINKNYNCDLSISCDRYELIEI